MDLHYFVAGFGVVILLIGLWLAISPAGVKGIVARFRKPQMIYVAGGARIVLGLLLILAAPYCRPEYATQTVIRIFGVLTLAAGIVFLLLGPQRMIRFIDYWLNTPMTFARIWALVALAVGAYFIWASGAW